MKQDRQYDVCSSLVYDLFILDFFVLDFFALAIFFVCFFQRYIQIDTDHLKSTSEKLFARHFFFIVWKNVSDIIPAI